MPARTFIRVLLPAPLWPMMPSRSPSRRLKLTPLRASTRMKALKGLRNRWRTKNSLRVIRPCCLTLKVRLPVASAIRARKPSSPRALRRAGHPPRQGLELENQPPLKPVQDQGGQAEGEQAGEPGGGVVDQPGHLPLQDRLADQFQEV